MQEFDQLIAKMEYQKSMNQNYLVYKNECEEENYELRMLAENQIGHLLPIELRSIDGRDDIYYKIESFQPLSKLYKNREMKLEDVRIVLIGLTEAIAAIQEYMLDERHVVLLPDYMFIHTESREVRLLFHPFYEGDVREGVRDFADYLIGRIDHTDQQAVMMGYQFYRIVREDNFITEDIVKLYRQEQKNIADKSRGVMQEGDFEISKGISEDEFLKAGRYAVEDTDMEGSRGKEINQHRITNDGYKKSDHKKEYKNKNPNLKKLFIFSVMALLSGIFLCFGIGYYRPDRMAKVILTLILLVSVLGVCKEIFQHFRDRRDGNPEENRYDKIFAGYEKKFINETGGLYQQNPVGMEPIETKPIKTKLMEQSVDFMNEDYQKEFYRKGEYRKRDFKEEEYQIENKHEKNTQREDDQKEINQNAESEIYGRTVLLSGGGRMAMNILIEKRHGKEIVHQIEDFPYLIGKIKNSVNLVLNDVSVSRIHAKLTEEDGQVYVQDCNSTNGTYVNGVLLEKEEKIPVEAEDEIRVGRIILLYQ